MYLKKILILGASLLQIPTILEAKKMGLFTIVVDMDRNAPGIKYADDFFEISTLDKDEIFLLAKEERICAIATAATDRPMETVAYISDKLSLDIVSSTTIAKSTNKFYMREELKRSGVPIPRYAKVEKSNDILNFINKNKNIDFILKPANSSGSRGIRFIPATSSIEEIEEAFQYTKSATNLDYILVEEYMPGEEVSVESIMVNGKNHIIVITDKITTGSPYFVELGHSQPSQLSEDIQSKIRRIVSDSLSAIGYTNGVSHVEVKITGSCVRIVEIGLRLGGDCITSHLVPLSTGVNIVRQNLNFATKSPLIYTHTKNRGAAIMFIEAREGKIKDIKNENELNSGFVEEIVFTKKIGDEVFGTKQSGDRIGYVICDGSTPEIAQYNCKKALEKIEIIYE